MRLSTEVPSRNDSFLGSRRAKTSRALAQLLIISMANSVARSRILVGAHPPVTTAYSLETFWSELSALPRWRTGRARTPSCPPRRATRVRFPHDVESCRLSGGTDRVERMRLVGEGRLTQFPFS